MDPETIAKLVEMFGSLGGAASDIFGGGGGGGAERMPHSEEAWWQAQPWAMQGAQSGGMFQGEYADILRNALEGNMGLSPEVKNMMFGQAQQQLRPQFAQQQDVLRSSFNPRLAGSGAMASAMGNLLGRQGQTTGGLATGINIQDILQRTGAQQQAMGQFGGLWQGQKQMQNAAMNTWLRWLGM